LLGGRAVAAIRLTAQAGLDDGLQVRGVFLAGPAHAAGRLLADGARRLQEFHAVELVGQPPRQHLEEQHAQGVDVRPYVGAVDVAAHLLRAHVRQGADDAARLLADGRQPCVHVRQPGHAEVQHLGLPVGAHEDVRGLQVAVDDAAQVGVVDRLADLDEEPQARA